MNRLKQFVQFLRYVAETFYDDRCLRSSAALTYTTLLSLVPLTTVIFSVFAAFPMFNSFDEQIRHFVFENFVPTSSEAIQHYIEEFSGKTSSLTAIGTVFLILSALLMMNTIEGAMNDIWHIKKTRRPIPKFMVYWAMLTLGPILVGASLAVTSYLTSLPFFNETSLIAGLKAKLLGLLPFFSTTIACTLLYAVVPNTYVPLRHAFTGALVAALLFELAKKGFALYVTAFPTYEMIYGALATIPVFLVWLYLSWMVVMLGAEISFCLYHKPGTKDDGTLTAGQMLLNDFKVIGIIWQAQQQDRLLSEDELVQHKQTEGIDIRPGLARLQEGGLLHQTTDGQWALSKDGSRLTLADLYKSQGDILPEIDIDATGDDPLALALAHALAHSNRHIREALGIHLQPIYQHTLRHGTAEHKAEGTDKVATGTQPAQKERAKEQPGKERIEPTIEL